MILSDKNEYKDICSHDINQIKTQKFENFIKQEIQNSNCKLFFSKPCFLCIRKISLSTVPFKLQKALKGKYKNNFVFQNRENIKVINKLLETSDFGWKSKETLFFNRVNPKIEISFFKTSESRFWIERLTKSHQFQIYKMNLNDSNFDIIYNKFINVRRNKIAVAISNLLNVLSESQLENNSIHLSRYANKKEEIFENGPKLRPSNYILTNSEKNSVPKIFEIENNKIFEPQKLDFLIQNFDFFNRIRNDENKIGSIPKIEFIQEIDPSFSMSFKKINCFLEGQDINQPVEIKDFKKIAEDAERKNKEMEMMDDNQLVDPINPQNLIKSLLKTSKNIICLRQKKNMMLVEKVGNTTQAKNSNISRFSKIKNGPNFLKNKTFENFHSKVQKLFEISKVQKNRSKSPTKISDNKFARPTIENIKKIIQNRNLKTELSQRKKVNPSFKKNKLINETQFSLIPKKSEFLKNLRSFLQKNDVASLDNIGPNDLNFRAESDIENIVQTSPINNHTRMLYHVKSLGNLSSKRKKNQSPNLHFKNTPKFKTNTEQTIKQAIFNENSPQFLFKSMKSCTDLQQKPSINWKSKENGNDCLKNRLLRAKSLEHPFKKQIQRSFLRQNFVKTKLKIVFDKSSTKMDNLRNVKDLFLFKSLEKNTKNSKHNGVPSIAHTFCKKNNQSSNQAIQKVIKNDKWKFKDLFLNDFRMQKTNNFQSRLINSKLKLQKTEKNNEKLVNNVFFDQIKIPEALKDQNISNRKRETSKGKDEFLKLKSVKSNKKFSPREMGKTQSFRLKSPINFNKKQK